MIQEFSVKNFLSFNEKQTISFLASSDKKLLNELTFEPKKGTKILKLLMIYGANASGKSNLLVAIQTLWKLLIFPEEKENETIDLYQPFKLNKNDSTEFEIIFWINDRKFKYNINFNQEVILYERMDYLSDSNVMSLLYERKFNKNIKFGNTINIKSKEKNDFNLNTLKNHTVLSTLNKKNIKAPEIILDLYNWIENNIHESASHNNPLGIAEYANKNEKIKSFLLEMLNKADFNIIDFKIFESKIFNDKKIEEIKQDKDIPDYIKHKLLKPQKELFFVHKNNQGKEFEINFSMESAGTQAYFRLSKLLIELNTNSIVILEDELEDSLHYDLLIHFLEIFIKTDKKSQLIFSTHNQMILNEDWLFRRDMICFVEKSNQLSASEIYKASDFGLHKNISILNAYKTGKLGAKPNLGSTYLRDI